MSASHRGGNYNDLLKIYCNIFLQDYINIVIILIIFESELASFKSRESIFIFGPSIFSSSWVPLVLAEWHGSSLIPPQRRRRMLEFTAKVSPVRLPDSPALNQRKQPLISGQWAESLHFWSLPPADRKWLFLLVPRVLLVRQPSDFIRAWMRASERRLRWKFQLHRLVDRQEMPVCSPLCADSLNFFFFFSY